MRILCFSQILMMSFMGVSVWQDLKTRSLSVYSLVVFGGLILTAACLTGTFLQPGWLERIGSMGIGVALLLISKVSQGAVGEGDGWFLMITGMVLGFWSNLAVLLYGLLFCSCYSLGLIVWGCLLKVNVRKKAIPFLPFLLPAGIWMVLL